MMVNAKTLYNEYLIKVLTFSFYSFKLPHSRQIPWQIYYRSGRKKYHLDYLYICFNPFHATGLFLYSLKNIGQPEVFRGYKKRPRFWPTPTAAFKVQFGKPRLFFASELKKLIFKTFYGRQMSSNTSANEQF